MFQSLSDTFARRKLFISSSGSYHGSDVTWQEISCMSSSVCCCPRPSSENTIPNSNLAKATSNTLPLAVGDGDVHLIQCVWLTRSIYPKTLICLAISAQPARVTKRQGGLTDRHQDH